MRAAIYARVSTSDQNCELQLGELGDYVARRNWELVRKYVDNGISGKSINKRLAFQELMSDAVQRKFDVVLVLKIDRFSRSIVDFVNSLQQLETSGVRFIATSQGIDTDQSNPAARLQMNILSAVSEFEREIIRERSQLGFQQYQKDYQLGKIGKDKSSKSGKNLPIGRAKKIFDRDKVSELKSEGFSIREISRMLGISVGTVASVQKTV